MGRIPLFTILVVVLSAHIAPAQSETQFVTDQLQAILRAGESTRHKTIRMLPSGTPLEVLGIDQSTKYARVRTEDGTLGYVLISQLQKEPTAQSRIADIQARLTELQKEPDTLASQLAKLESEHASLIEHSQALKQAKQQLEQELATIRHASSNVLAITNERDRLRIQVSEVNRDREELMQAHKEIKNQTKQRWFMIGAAVMTAGVLIGLILPNLKYRRRKSTWGNF